MAIQPGRAIPIKGPWNDRVIKALAHLSPVAGPVPTYCLKALSTAASDMTCVSLVRALGSPVLSVSSMEMTKAGRFDRPGLGQHQ